MSSLKESEAIYRCSVHIGQRSKGHSAVAAAAYRSGSTLTDRRQGDQRHDYSGKKGVVAAFILTPPGAPQWASDRNELWNREEQAAKRKDASTYREVVITIPREIPSYLHRQYVEEICQPYLDAGAIVDAAIHDVKASDGGRNIHTHIMLTSRKLDPTTESGFAASKNQDLIKIFDSGGRYGGGKKGDALRRERQRVADVTNDYLRSIGSPKRVDHRSYADRDDDRQAEPKFGEQAAKLYRATGKPSELQKLVGILRQQKQVKRYLEHLALKEYEIMQNVYDKEAATTPEETYSKKHLKMKLELIRQKLPDFDYSRNEKKLMLAIGYVDAKKEGQLSIQMRDGSFLQYEEPSVANQHGAINIFHPKNREIENCQAAQLGDLISMCKGIDAKPQLMKKTAAVKEAGLPPVEDIEEEVGKSLVQFWREFGIPDRQMQETGQGLLINLGGGSKIRDVATHIDLIGLHKQRTIDAIIHKAKSDWNGRIEAVGSIEFKNRLWLECKRNGVELVGHEPDAKTKKTWEREHQAQMLKTAELEGILEEFRTAEKLIAYLNDDTPQSMRPKPSLDLQRVLAEIEDEDVREQLKKSTPLEAARIVAEAGQTFKVMPAAEPTAPKMGG